MINIYGLRFGYVTGGFELNVPQLIIDRGETVAVIGPSGSGKTTLLNILAGILRPEQGRVVVDETNLAVVDERNARNFRAAQIGLIFQEFELLEYLNVLDNILLPFRINRELRLTVQVRDAAEELAARVGIGDKLDRFPNQLSQGERQRAAVCRALITGPKLLLADEPTGNLDPQNKEKVLQILLDCVREQGATLVTVTHDYELVPHFDRVVDFNSLTATTGQVAT
jgi:putative ABC transport system ATP-binding protein